MFSRGDERKRGRLVDVGWSRCEKEMTAVAVRALHNNGIVGSKEKIKWIKHQINIFLIFWKRRFSVASVWQAQVTSRSFRWNPFVLKGPVEYMPMELQNTQTRAHHSRKMNVYICIWPWSTSKINWWRPALLFSILHESHFSISISLDNLYCCACFEYFLILPALTGTLCRKRMRGHSIKFIHNLFFIEIFRKKKKFNENNNNEPV